MNDDEMIDPFGEGPGSDDKAVAAWLIVIFAVLGVGWWIMAALGVNP